MKKSIITAISAVVCMAIACGVYGSVSYRNKNSDIEMIEKPIQSQTKTEIVTDESVTLHEAETKEDDNVQEESSQAVDTINRERIRPLFTPTKRITADMDEVQKQEYSESTQTVRKDFEDKYGISPEANESDMTEKQRSALGIDYTYDYIDRIKTLKEKFVEDGYGYEGILKKVTANADSDEYMLNYCDKMTMICNAYNDPDYEISDTDRLRILNKIEYSVITLKRYLNKHPNDALSEVKETLEYEEMTYAAEYGHKTLEG